MILSSRLFRRVIIAMVFLAVFFFTGLGLKKVVTPVASCTDGIKNGEEEGIDCGLFACNNYCEPDLDPPKVLLTKLIKAGDRDYDFVAVIENPHAQFGASEVAYELVLSNGEKGELDRDQGTFYILPGQTKYFILTNITTENDVKNIDFKINSAKWQRIDSLEGMNLIVKNKKMIPVSGPGASLEGLIKNESDFDLAMVDIDVVLFNRRDEIIAVNRTDVRTLLGRTERSFIVVWPFRINDTVARSEVFPSTNLFENLNFVKRYGSGVEKFQEYKHTVTY